MLKTKRNLLYPLGLSVAIIASDQLSKAAVVSAWPADGRAHFDLFRNGLVEFTHVRNKAIAFSLGESLPDSLRAVLFTILPVIVIIALIIYYFRSPDFTHLQRWALAGIIGGGVGNLIDRIFRPDGVVDFISVKFFGLFGLERWPTFNIADASVVISGIALFMSVLFALRERQEGDK